MYDVDKLRREFSKVFCGDLPQHIVRAPGRINIIGEHIDYCGYDVLPMAIEQSIYVLIGATSNDIITVQNVNSSKYKKFQFHITDKIEITGSDWKQYFFCAYSALREISGELNHGCNILIHSTLQPAAGLSSSSAFIVGCTAALLKQYEKEEIEKLKIAELCIRCERLIGVEGGGMDQTVCCLGEKNKILQVSFKPKLKVEPIELPSETIKFIVCHSTVTAAKAATDNYNIRVKECRSAVQFLAKKFKGSVQNEKSMPRELQDNMNISLGEIIVKIKMVLKEMEGKDVIMLKRILHVYTEALRVQEFVKICNESDEKDIEKTKIKLGNLMKESHKSCDELYDCSCEQLNELVELAKTQKGVYGARLTGAGWGGCCIVMVEAGDVEEFINNIWKSFYNKYGFCDIDKSELIFPSSASCGVEYIN